jgi:hypothetical protein
MALEALLCSGNDTLPQHWSVLRVIHTLNSPKNYTHLLGGLSPVNYMHLCGAQGLMWGTRGASCRQQPWPAMVVLVIVGR